MKILINCLVFGKRPLNIIADNLNRKGFDCDIKFVDVEGIANALNEGIKDFEKYDAIGFLANDIIEPDNWLLKKVEALNTYPNAGIVASSLDCERVQIQSELIISNWLISTKLIEAIGEFNEQYFPYGAIDLDYCERSWLAGFKTYYVMNCLAVHNGSHATGNEYGWNKTELVSKYSALYNDNLNAYKNGTKSIKI
jgi:GT2 family glycosyltransferase